VDPDRYRNKEEVQKGRTSDPIAAFAARLTAAGLLDENGAHEIDERAQRDVDAAVTFAEESPFPSVEAFMSDLYNYVYAPDDTSIDIKEKGD
jgi:pyruvate dehydrogenase E1 component alpha subunit